MRDASCTGLPFYIDRVSDDEAPPAPSGELGDAGGDVSPSGASFEGNSDLPGSSGAVPLEEEEYTS